MTKRLITRPSANLLHGPARRWQAAAVLFTLLTLWHTGVVAAAKPINSIVAVVNDEVILSSELESEVSAIRQRQRAQRISPPPEEVLRRTVLEHLIIAKLELQLAHTQGIRVSDEMLNEAVQKIAAQNKLQLSAFKRTLEKEGFVFADFRESIRKEITINRLRQRRIADRIAVTEQEIKDFLATQTAQGNIDDEYRLGHILIAIPEAATPAQINAKKSEAEAVLDKLRKGGDFSQTAIAESRGQNALKGGDMGWRKAGELPTPFVPVVTTMQTGEISGLIRTPSGFHIIKLTDKKGGPKHIITQYKVRHILIKPDALKNSAEVQRRLANIKERVENGEKFPELAKVYSEDKASASQGGSLDWVSPGQMVPIFERTMKQTPVNRISRPFRTPFGWHILQVMDKRNQDNTTEFKRAKARDLIHRRKFNEELDTWRRQIREEAYVDIRLENYLP